MTARTIFLTKLRLPPARFMGTRQTVRRQPRWHPHASPRADSRMAWDQLRQDGSVPRSIRAMNMIRPLDTEVAGSGCRARICQEQRITALHMLKDILQLFLRSDSATIPPPPNPWPCLLRPTG